MSPSLSPHQMNEHLVRCEAERPYVCNALVGTQKCGRHFTSERSCRYHEDRCARGQIVRRSRSRSRGPSVSRGPSMVRELSGEPRDRNVPRERSGAPRDRKVKRERSESRERADVKPPPWQMPRSAPSVHAHLSAYYSEQFAQMNSKFRRLSGGAAALRLVQSAEFSPPAHVDCNCRVLEGLMSPVSDHSRKPDLASSVHRVRMAQLATESSDWIRADGWESAQPGWTPTLEVLRQHRQELRRKYSDDQLRMIMQCGGDTVDSFVREEPCSPDGSLWQVSHLQEIFEQFGLIVIQRAGANARDTLSSPDLHFLQQLIANAAIIEDATFPNAMASSRLRAALRHGQCISHCTPDAVVQYIQEHQLYQQPGLNNNNCVQEKQSHKQLHITGKQQSELYLVLILLVIKNFSLRVRLKSAVCSSLQLAMDAQQLQQLLNALQQMVTNAVPQNAAPANLSNANLASSIDAAFRPSITIPRSTLPLNAGLNEASKVRLLLGKLGEEEYNKYRDTISPTQPDQVNWNDTISHLKQLFAETRSLFVRRYECFKIRKQQGQDVSSLIAQINASCENADLSLTKEQLSALKMLEDSQKNGTGISLKKIEEKLRAIQLVKESALSLVNPPIVTNAITQGRDNGQTQHKDKAVQINGNIKMPIQVGSQRVVAQHFRVDHVANVTTGAPIAHSRTPLASSATKRGIFQQFAVKRKQSRHRTTTGPFTQSKSTRTACMLAQLKADGGNCAF
ncbi:hypothetical protein niasHT_038254 [Heterodera trifolii]|uniref:Uncharacterized protein n=1 Tax=Heterodera trifolii TaxID=157864 RepID=A0ABD2I8W9_9BILA